MKAVLEPNEILIRQVPNEKCPNGCYYITEISSKSTATWSEVKYTLEEVVQWLCETFEPEIPPKE